MRVDVQRPLVISSGFLSILLVDEIHKNIPSSDDGFHEERVERQSASVALQRLVELLQAMITKGEAVKKAVIFRVFGHCLPEVVEGVLVVERFEVSGGKYTIVAVDVVVVVVVLVVLVVVLIFLVVVGVIAVNIVVSDLLISVWVSTSVITNVNRRIQRPLSHPQLTAIPY